jgi:hypothetical protein
MDIEILEGEEWWASEAVDDASKLIIHLQMLAELCLKMDILAEKANILISNIKAHSPSKSIELEPNSWLDFCRQLRDTSLSDKSAFVENMINEFVKKHLPLNDK